MLSCISHNLAKEDLLFEYLQCQRKWRGMVKNWGALREMGGAVIIGVDMVSEGETQKERERHGQKLEGTVRTQRGREGVHSQR